MAAADPQGGVSRQGAVDVTGHVVPAVKYGLMPETAVEFDDSGETDVLDVAKRDGPSRSDSALPVSGWQAVGPLHSSEVSVLQHGVRASGHVRKDRAQELASGKPSASAKRAQQTIWRCTTTLAGISKYGDGF